MRHLQEDRVFEFFAGPNNEYEPLRSEIVNQDPIPIVEQVYHKVLSEEGRRQIIKQYSSICRA